MLRYMNQTSNKAGRLVNSEVSRIISAAVINKRFCNTLLSNPSAAISQGYCGEPFCLSTEQQDQISMIKEHSLEGFAAQLAQI